MKTILLTLIYVSILSSCTLKKAHIQDDTIVANGQMPNIVKDNNGNIQLVYGFGDSIMYANLPDNGNNFSKPTLIAILPNLAASHTRGPQIATANNELTVIACNDAGNIFSYYKDGSGNWLQSVKINDVDSVAKENLMSLSESDGKAFAVWLDTRGNGQNKIYGAKSTDVGRTWSKNFMIYTSPDNTVCQCCKPSVVVKGNNIYVMFRNWLKGNRDMYLIQSNDGGNTFGQAQKLGTGDWKLNGCPMDGGGLTINSKGTLQTVWRREGKVYSSMPGLAEREIGEGKGCSIETINEKNIYAWAENDGVVFINSKGEKKLLGKGNLPVIKALNNEVAICVWQNEKEIHSAIGHAIVSTTRRCAKR